jgi:hypothetical protein
MQISAPHRSSATKSIRGAPSSDFPIVEEVEDDRKKKKTKNVLTQLETYSNYVADKDRRQEIIVAYRETCRLLTWFWSMRGEQNPLHPLIEAAARGDSNLVIDRKPRLVIFSSEGGIAPVLKRGPLY